ncbi:MAG: hypothetical protein AAGB51_00805 [Planctomycetota bacterium]
MSGVVGGGTIGRSGRLWADLAKPQERTLALRGADVFGSTVVGIGARFRRARTERGRAKSILTEARTLSDHSSAAFAERVSEAQSLVLLDRSSRAAVDAAYACAVEAVRRTLGFELHTVQVMAALAMAKGCCCELATGEGKTAAAILPAALDGMVGRGVHVITVNDYLAGRDAEITGPAYRLLGLRVGFVTETSSTEARREAYSADITYAAEKQLIFDYLRDRLLTPVNPRMASALLDEVAGYDRRVRGAETERGDAKWAQTVTQRGLHAAVIDEADSVLIDQAGTPAIIGRDAPEELGEAAAERYRTSDAIAASLTRGVHYKLDEGQRFVALTDAGRHVLDERSVELPPFWSGPRRREELVKLSLMARETFERDDDYVVRDGAVELVDRQTGRVLTGRQWQQGLHQAVEAKEGVTITAGRQTMSRIGYAAFFARYRRLCGMSGTCWETRHELWRMYRLPVARVPTHKRVRRRHAGDRVFTSETQKFEAVANRTAKLSGVGRPVLIGTRSVAASERLGKLLDERGVGCKILNAYREAEEAEIIAAAGEEHAVTVATNMAGRGTDIKLTKKAKKLGGLVVVATERHNERRVDRQLFGRAGRQGDPGRAEMFVSLDDELVRGAMPTTGRLALRLTPPPFRSLLGRLLLPVSQRIASGRAAVHRLESWKHDSSKDLALRGHTR